MFSAIYVENEILNHPKTTEILTRFNRLPVITCNHYGEIFNRKKQSFASQKQNPALILAEKKGRHLLQTPPSYGIGGSINYYFSHMINCIFDCRYCFLQGMFRSAHYVFFVNSGEFINEMDRILNQNPKSDIYFFSGYDCDSLALESVTGFAKNLLPFFKERKRAFLEMRTKSTNITFLEKNEPLKNCIIAFTLSPKAVVDSLEHKTPSLKMRLQALSSLQKLGWPIGLRFDPVIYMDRFEIIYKEFFEQVFETIVAKKVHSVTLGAFRVPKPLFKNMVRHYPDEKLFSHSLEENNKLISYQKDKEQRLLKFCYQKIAKHIPENLIFSCKVS